MKLIKEEKDILTEDRLDQCRNDANSICRYIDKNGMGVWYDLIDYDMYPMNTSKVSFQVQGDWKHDHARFKNLVYDWAEENGRDIFKIDSIDLDDGDSDNYTARYDVFITADKDSFDRLNSMRGLFSEGLNDREKQIYIDSVNEAEDIDDLKEIVHEIYWYDKALFVKINKFPPDRDFEEIKANILKNLGAVDESLTEDRSLAKPFKKELKNAYKSFDASRDSVRKKNDAVVKTWNQAADGIPMDDNAKKILLKPEPKFSRFKPDRSNSLEREEYPFYVTYYEETPYYHPEEGGYYVAGRQAIMSKGFDNKEDALKFAKEAADKFGFERIDDTWYHLGSRYIGEDDSVRVETKREYLSREEGDSVYESLAEELSTEAKRNALDRINTEGGYAAYDLEDAAMKYQPDAKDLNDLTDDTVEKVYTDLKNDFINKLKVYGDDADLDGVLYDVFGVSESLKESLGADIDKLEQQISDMEVGDSVIVKNYKNGDTYEFVKRNDSNQISAFENIRGKNHMASPMQVFGWAKDSLIYAHFSPQFLSSDLTEDTIKTKDGKWTNKGDEGTHGKFNTKKEADAQRRAMFSNGYRENLKESIHDWPIIIDNTQIQLPISENELIYFIETNFLTNYNIDFIDEVKLVTSGVDEANRKYYNLKVSGFLKQNKMFKVPVRVWENGDIEDSRNPLPPVENVIDESAVWVDGNGKEIQRPMSSFGEPNVDYSLISKQAKDYKEKQNIIRNLIQTYDQVKIQGMSPIVALIRDNAGNTIYRFDFLEKNKNFDDQIAEFKSLVGKELKESSSSLEKEIYAMLNDMGGYTDYQGRIDAVADEFNMSKDEAEGYVCNWIQFYDEESDMDESLKEDIPVVAGSNTKFTFDNDFINYNDFLADNFDSWSDDIDYLMKDLNKCAKALRTSANKLVFYKDYDEDFYAIDDISTVVDHIAEDYSMYELSGTGIRFIVCADFSPCVWIFKNEQEGNRVVNSIKSYVSSLNEDFKLEGLVDIHDDFQFARENWKKLVPDVDFDIALERWNKESKLAEPVHWYAKPLYSSKAWDDMVQMFQKTDIPEIEEPEEQDIDDSDDSDMSFNDDFDAESEE